MMNELQRKTTTAEKMRSLVFKLVTKTRSCMAWAWDREGLCVHGEVGRKDRRHILVTRLRALCEWYQQKD
jgi:hypothetical protein